MAESGADTAGVSHILTLLFTDLADSTALKTQRGDHRVGERIARHRALVGTLAAASAGRVIDWAGDGFFLTFETPSAAVAFALRLQQAHVAESDLPGVRTGIHRGEVSERSGPGGDAAPPRVEGLAVDLAARICGLARPAQVLMSSAVAESARQRLVVATIVGVAIAGAFWWSQARRTEATTKPTRKSVAVLPFVHMSSDRENEYFSDGITEDLITWLAKVSGLHVAARTSSFAFKGKLEDIQEIGEQLQVGAVLAGSVAKAGKEVPITAQPINVEEAYPLWSGSYDRELKDVFAIRSEVARTVAHVLQVTLAAGERESLERKPTEDLEAYQLYLKARLGTESLTSDGVRNAIVYLQEAVARDPSYEEAIEVLRATLLRNPDLPYAGLFLARAYAHAGRFEGALDALRNLETEDSGGAEYASAIGRIHADAGNTEEAARVLDRLRERMREEYVSDTFLATVQLGLHDTDGALASLAQAAKEHSYYVPWWNVDPDLDRLRFDPRFTELRKSVGLAR